MCWLIQQGRETVRQKITQLGQYLKEWWEYIRANDPTDTRSPWKKFCDHTYEAPWKTGVEAALAAVVALAVMLPPIHFIQSHKKATKPPTKSTPITARR